MALRLRSVNALMVRGTSAKVRQGIFLYLLALGEEGSEHDCPRCLQKLATKVCFGHGALNGDWLAILVITTEGEFHQCPDGRYNIGKVGH